MLFLDWLDDVVKKFRSDGLLSTVYRGVDYFRRRIYSEYQRLKLGFSYRQAVPEPFKVLYINPDEIRHLQVSSFVGGRATYRDSTHVLGGDWDRPLEETDGRGVKPFEEYSRYQRSKQYIEDDRDWESIDFEDTDRINHKKQKIQKVARLYDKIKDEGYRSMRDIGIRRPLFPPEREEVRVAIGRKGEFIFQDGRHRLIASKLLGIEEIPVVVLIRHKEWQEKREKAVNNLEELDQKYRKHPDIEYLIQDS